MDDESLSKSSLTASDADKPLAIHPFTRHTQRSRIAPHGEIITVLEHDKEEH